MVEKTEGTSPTLTKGKTGPTSPKMAKGETGSEGPGSLESWDSTPQVEDPSRSNPLPLCPLGAASLSNYNTIKAGETTGWDSERTEGASRTGSRWLLGVALATSHPTIS